jgi:hypothetical protein
MKEQVCSESETHLIPGPEFGWCVHLSGVFTLPEPVPPTPSHREVQPE